MYGTECGLQSFYLHACVPECLPACLPAYLPACVVTGPALSSRLSAAEASFDARFHSTFPISPEVGLPSNPEGGFFFSIGIHMFTLFK